MLNFSRFYLRECFVVLLNVITNDKLAEINFIFFSLTRSKATNFRVVLCRVEYNSRGKVLAD